MRKLIFITQQVDPGHPALAADELGFFKAEGLDARIELVAMLGAT